MTVTLSHQTALREYFDNPRWGMLPREPLAMKAPSSNASVLESFDALGRNPERGHILVSNRSLRNKQSHAITCHALPPVHPAKTVVDVGDCFLASPELCFLQMAEQLTFEQLILLGFALCGNYDQTEREAISTVNALSMFAASCPQAKGRKQALRALHYVLDNSRSPMESRLALALTLPTVCGGFELPAPRMNVPIPGTVRKGDLCWMADKLIVEYDSHEYHATNEAQERDSERRAELLSRGFHVITVARSQAMNERLLLEIATCIADELGCKKRRRWDDYQAARRRTHWNLFRAGKPDALMGLKV